MNILIVCKLLDDFTIYDSCLGLHVVLCALHELNYNLKVAIWLSSLSLTTALSRFQTVLDYHYNFTLNSIFRPKAIIKKTCSSMSTTRWFYRDYVVDIEVHVFLDKGLWPKY